ncbi:reverse transcriptase, partial [Tanacetum coccineum]
MQIVGYRPSYVWRSFISVRELVRNGCKWNIGDGHRVNVWEDYWLEDHRRLGPKPDNCQENFLMILWGLWTRRNKKNYGQVDEKDANVEVMSKLLLMDYHKANWQQLTTTRTKATIKWTKPNGDYIKFNCDASWQKESGMVGLGFVARNARRDVLLSGARAECYASSPLEAEAKSLLWAINQAHNKVRSYGTEGRKKDGPQVMPSDKVYEY